MLKMFSFMNYKKISLDSFLDINLDNLCSKMGVTVNRIKKTHTNNRTRQRNLFFVKYVLKYMLACKCSSAVFFCTVCPYVNCFFFFLHCLEHAHKNFTHQGTCAVVM